MTTAPRCLCYEWIISVGVALYSLASLVIVVPCGTSGCALNLMIGNFNEDCIYALCSVSSDIYALRSAVGSLSARHMDGILTKC
jgi:hypothetical protein